ncbi:MAG: tetratricopeptide repeat protein [Deltaproteobacteria bacterium]|nr:tetratricopeptide repeat protein [Deltaproteobacteria bacterium]
MRKLYVISTIVVLAMALGAVQVWAGAQARIRGKVIGTDGKPVPDAVITITTDEMAGYEKKIAVKKNGSFAALILDATRHYKFTVQAPGYIDYEEPFKVMAGSTDNVFTFELKTKSEVQAEQRTQLFEQPGYKELKEGQELLDADKKIEAAAKLEEAIAAEPELVPAYVGLCEIAFALGEDEKALGHARTCLKLDDEELRCLAVATNASKKLGEDEAYQAYLARYQELNPDDPATLFNLAADLLNKMDDENARPLLERCLATDPDFPNCLFEFGMLLLRTGDLEGAKAQLQHYLEVAPDGRDATAASETIKYL